MNSYLEIFFWTVTIYIIAMAIVHFVKVLREKRENNTNLIKSIIYLACGLTLGMLMLYKPFGNITKFAEKILKAPQQTMSEAVMITTSTMGSSVSV